MTFALKIEMNVKLIKINQSKVSKLLISGRLTVSVIPSLVFIPLKLYGCTNVESKFFGKRFIKRRQIRLESTLQVSLDTPNFKHFSDSDSNHCGGPAIPL